MDSKTLLRKIGEYFFNLLLALDILLSALTGGTANETVSYRIGRMKKKHGGKIPWTRPDLKFLDWGLELIDPNHSVKAYEYDRFGRRIHKEERGNQ